MLNKGTFPEKIDEFTHRKSLWNKSQLEPNWETHIKKIGKINEPSISSNVKGPATVHTAKDTMSPLLLKSKERKNLGLKMKSNYLPDTV